MIFIRFLVFLLMVLFTITASAFDFPYLSGQIVDEAHVLSGSQYRQIKQNLSSLTQQVVVASVRTMEGLEIEEYANRLFNHWGLGDKERNDGVLIIIAPNQRQLRIEVGYGLEDILTDAIASRIVNQHMLPWAREGKYGQALVDASLMVRTVLDGNPLPSLSHHVPKNKKSSLTINGIPIEDMKFSADTLLCIGLGLAIIFGILGFAIKKIKATTISEAVPPVLEEDIKKSRKERALFACILFCFVILYGFIFINGLFFMILHIIFGIFWLTWLSLFFISMIYGYIVAWHKNKYFPITAMGKMTSGKGRGGRSGGGFSRGRSSGGFRGGGGRSGGGGSSGRW